MKNLIFILTFSLTMLIFSQSKFQNIIDLVESGKFSQAKTQISNLMQNKKNPLNSQEILELNYLVERMDRIKIDFTKTSADIIKYLAKYYPEIKEKDLKKFDNYLEHKIIDGKKFYFNQAGPNLFRINKEAKLVKDKVDGVKPSKLDEFLLVELDEVTKLVKTNNNSFVKPVKFTLNYTLTVDPNVVPDGEIIRCWLPYPREDRKRQVFLNSEFSEKNVIIAPKETFQRTAYMEKVAVKDQPTVFKMKLNYIAYSEWYKIDKDKILPYNKESELYKEFTAERYPHIVFTDELKKISKEIVGDEKNPYEIAKKIFTWVDLNIPWASAREYSTIPNIPMYSLTNRHGDCGIQTLLFMTLCRYNGIPTKWQSGWMLHPPEVNLHDWGEFYLEGYGWLPVDQSFGLKNSDNPDVKYFYLGGMDSYRLIANDDFSKPLFPTKIFQRSETVDFQRGEVEWRGGNLYFDKWDYNMKVEYSTP